MRNIDILQAPQAYLLGFAARQPIVSREISMLKRLLGVVLFVAVALVSQVGGLALALAWLAGRWLLPARLERWQRTGLGFLLFAGFYGLLHVVVVPPLAALGGRVPLPCAAEPDRPFAAARPLFCRLDRHYVDPRLVVLMTTMSREIAREYPGTITLYLDGNFPFLNGFPLLPHLSHSDGRKLDIAYYYRGPDGGYRPGELRSPIGYWAFEQPAPGETPSPCRAGTWLTTRWDMRFLQELFPDLTLEPDRTRAALRWLATQGQAAGIERIFVEPYLARRLGVSSPLLGFQGCRAARHDDHIHIQIGR
jgi:hypothetical protein